MRGLKVSYQWLGQYVDLTGITPDELADKLTRSGIEVDSVEARNKGVSGVVIGHVAEAVPHPNAERLKICRVDVGDGRIRTIVTGAPNILGGEVVPVALEGARLPGGVEIGVSHFRGVDSEGMLCSAQELGIDGKYFPKEIQEGILLLPRETKIGANAAEVLGLDDHILELDLTPNRSDCLSMLGVAYEVAALLGRPVRETEGKPLTPAGMEDWEIAIEAREDCSEYQAALIEGVRIGPSPLWLQNRLIASGLRPINNVVDITNYVMLEVGQPLHAFDAEKVGTGKIAVRRARAGERLKTLDGIERLLDEEMLLITDGVKPIGLAGVMGGEETEVTEETKRILLESALFSGSSIRRTARKLGLRSEASLRFEKGVDPARLTLALQRAVLLMEELAGGAGRPSITVETAKEEMRSWEVETSLPQIRKVLGMELSAESVLEVFSRLNLPVKKEGDRFIVTIFSRRPDLRIEVDLMEEIARLVGYDRIPTTLPKGEDTRGGWTRAQQLRRGIREYLISAGFTQVQNYSLVEKERVGLFAPIGEEKEALAVAMPMSEEHAYLRTDLLSSLLGAAEYNLNRNVEDLFLFELSKVFHPAELDRVKKLPDEPFYLAALASGQVLHDPLTKQVVTADFFFMKGIVEELFHLLSLPVRYRGEELKGLHPGRGAVILLHGERVGYLGQIHPTIAKERGIREETILFQMDLTPILEGEREEILFTPLPRYPGIRRDLSFLVDEEIPSERLIETMNEGTSLPLEEIRLFDLYQGAHVPAGKKSIAFTLYFRHPERTLSDEEVKGETEGIVRLLEDRFGAILRST